MIEFDRLSKRYGDLLAVREMTLRVDGGEVYALLGANGAGKTTALRCLATAGLVLENRFATWDLRPWRADADYAVSVLRR